MLSLFKPLYSALVVLTTAILCSCASHDHAPTAVIKDGAIISAKDQKMVILRQGKVIKTYPVSTSKFGLGDTKGSYKTPLGTHKIASKIGAGAHKGTVFKHRRPTGEILPPDSPGRDPIVTRILWLKGLESHNKNAYARMIYIHGTTEERTIGQPASYGCIRMKSDDVREAFNLLNVGDPVVVERCSIKTSLAALNQVPQTELGTSKKTSLPRAVQAPPLLAKHTAQSPAGKRSAKSKQSKYIAPAVSLPVSKVTPVAKQHRVRVKKTSTDHATKTIHDPTIYTL